MSILYLECEIERLKVAIHVFQLDEARRINRVSVHEGSWCHHAVKQGLCFVTNISGFRHVISWKAEFSLGVKIWVRYVQLCSEASLQIKDSSHSSLIRCQSSGRFGLFYISLPSLRSRASLEPSEIRLFKLMCSIPTEQLPHSPGAKRSATS